MYSDEPNRQLDITNGDSFRAKETRIDPKTGVIQKETIFGWIDTKERVHPKTGKRQVQGWLGWRNK